jgi:hypothetical protein
MRNGRLTLAYPDFSDARIQCSLKRRHYAGPAAIGAASRQGRTHRRIKNPPHAIGTFDMNRGSYRPILLLNPRRLVHRASDGCRLGFKHTDLNAIAQYRPASRGKRVIAHVKQHRYHDSCSMRNGDMIASGMCLYRAQSVMQAALNASLGDHALIDAITARLRLYV